MPPLCSSNALVRFNRDDGPAPACRETSGEIAWLASASTRQQVLSSMLMAKNSIKRSHRFPMSFSQSVRQVRIQKGFTQAELAEALCLPPASGATLIEQWEKGAATPSRPERFSYELLFRHPEALAPKPDCPTPEEFQATVIDGHKALRLNVRQLAQVLHLEEGAYPAIRAWESGDTAPGTAARFALSETIKGLTDGAPFASSGSDPQFSFIDLFAGIGGMHLAFSQAGGRCVYASEWDEWSQRQYVNNFGVMPRGDITKESAAAIPDHDILVAGFPCQPFSLAGVSKKNSLGRPTGFLDKTQGTLFFDVARILASKRPPAFMLENVKHLLSHDHGTTWRVISETLEQLDYHVFAKVLDADGLVPQHRERIIIAGFDRRRFKEVDFTFDIRRPSVSPFLQDILEDDVPATYTLSDKLWAYLQGYAQKHAAQGNGFGCNVPDLAGSSRTLSARYYKDGAEILIDQGPNRNPRRLTPRECARLQGFPEEYRIVVSDCRAYKQFGNSVAVPLIEQVAELILAKLKTLGWSSLTESNPC